MTQLIQIGERGEFANTVCLHKRNQKEIINRVENIAVGGSILIGEKLCSTVLGEERGIQESFLI